MKKIIYTISLVFILCTIVPAQNAINILEQQLGKTREQIESLNGPPGFYYRGKMSYSYPTTAESVVYEITDGRAYAIRYIKMLKSNPANNKMEELKTLITDASYEKMSDNAYRKGRYFLELSHSELSPGIWSVLVIIKLL